MQEIDLVYKTTHYKYDSVREGVIVRENEIVAYTSGPRDQGGAKVFLIGAFLENPPDYVPGEVVAQVKEIVAQWSVEKQRQIEDERRGEKSRAALAKQQQREQAERDAANAERRTHIWRLKDPWRQG